MRTIDLVAVLLLTSATMVAAAADQPGVDWINANQVAWKMIQAGYSSVTKIKAEKGQWKGEGVKDGKMHEFRMDPHTGAITNDEVEH